MSSSTRPVGGLPQRGGPVAGNKLPVAPAGQQSSAEPAWPLGLGRKPVPPDANGALPTGTRGQKQTAPAPLPTEGRGARTKAVPSDQGPRTARTNTAGSGPQPTEGDILISAPPGLNVKQTKTNARAPPQSGPAAPSFSVPRPLAGRANRDTPDVPEVPSSQPLRTGQTNRPGQPIPEALRSGMPPRGQGQGAFPSQPGPAPSVPVPTPSRSPQRNNTKMSAFPEGQDAPPPLRLGTMGPKGSQKAGALGGAMNQAEAAPSNPFSPQDDTKFGAKAPNSQAQTSGGSLFNRKPVNGPTQTATPGSMDPKANPLRSSPPNPSLQPGNPAGTNTLKSSPPNRPAQPGARQGPSVYRPSGAPTSPPQRQNTTTFGATQIMSSPEPLPPRVTSPPGFSGARPGPTRPGPTRPGPMHGHSDSLDSNMSNDSMASSATATSTRPLNPTQRQNTGFGKPARQDSDFARPEKNGRAGGGYYTGEAGAPAQTPYMNMLLSLDKIPRMHNILVSFFAWILLAGFVVMPGSFTSAKRGKQDGASVNLPLGAGAGGDKVALTPANTVVMVIGFVLIVTGTFGSAWLALRWRRNYVWLLNKLYLPLIANALAGALSTVVQVYTQQEGDWSTQAIITVIIEAAVLGLSIILFVVYNYRLLRRVREYENGVSSHDSKDKKSKKKKKKGKRRGLRGFFARFRRARNEPPMAPGSVV